MGLTDEDIHDEDLFDEVDTIDDKFTELVTSQPDRDEVQSTTVTSEVEDVVQDKAEGEKGLVTELTDPIKDAEKDWKRFSQFQDEYQKLLSKYGESLGMNPSLDKELETGSGMEEKDSSETIEDVLKQIEKSKKQHEAHQQYTLEFNELMAKYGDLMSEGDIPPFAIQQGSNQTLEDMAEQKKELESIKSHDADLSDLSDLSEGIKELTESLKELEKLKGLTKKLEGLEALLDYSDTDSDEESFDDWLNKFNKDANKDTDSDEFDDWLNNSNKDANKKVSPTSEKSGVKDVKLSPVGQEKAEGEKGLFAELTDSIKDVEKSFQDLKRLSQFQDEYQKLLSKYGESLGMNPSLVKELETGSGMEEKDSSETIEDVLKQIEKSKKQHEAHQQYTLEFNELMAKYGDLMSEGDIPPFAIQQGSNQTLEDMAEQKKELESIKSHDADLSDLSDLSEGIKELTESLKELEKLKGLTKKLEGLEALLDYSDTDSDEESFDDWLNKFNKDANKDTDSDEFDDWLNKS